MSGKQANVCILLAAKSEKTATVFMTKIINSLMCKKTNEVDVNKRKY